MAGLHNAKRRRARELALQISYCLDILSIDDTERALEAMEGIYSSFEVERDKEVTDYTEELVIGVMKNRVEIDNMIRMNVTGWTPERMASTDRVAARVAIYEAIIAKNVSAAIAISEAMELAKVFGTDESARFVNGVLGKVARSEQKQEGQNAEEESGGVVV